MLEKRKILGVGITNASMDKILEYITRGLKKADKKYFIVTPNPEILTLANSDSSYKNILNKAEIALGDGVGVIMASRIFGKSLKARVTGVDLLENLCRIASEKPITVGFLGGRDRVADKTAECLRLKYPNLKVAFAGAEWSKDDWGSPRLVAEGAEVAHENFLVRNAKKVMSSNPPKNPANANSENFVGSPRQRFLVRREARPFSVTPHLDILFVAFGAPKQERWIYENLDKIPVKVAIGVGGAFDYISGNVPRAPLWIQQIGFEWLFRLVIQPWRIKRQLALIEFAWLVLKEKFLRRHSGK